MNNISSYFYLENLPANLKSQWKIRSEYRLDCTRWHSEKEENPLREYITKVNQLYLYKRLPRDYVTASTRRLSELSLTQGSKHLTSIYIPSIDHAEYGYGDYNGDCYLFKLVPESGAINDIGSIKGIETYIIPNGKYFQNQFYQLFLDGELDEEIKAIKDKSKPFFDY